MKKVLLTDDQLKGLFACLDIVLRAEGLSSLKTVVDLHNTLNTAVEEILENDKENPEGA